MAGVARTGVNRNCRSIHPEIERDARGAPPKAVATIPDMVKVDLPFGVCQKSCSVPNY
jgi:hypothetical protein